jgi:hypothetical protein
MCVATLLFTFAPAKYMHAAKKPRVLAYLLSGGFSIAPLIHAAGKRELLS